MLPHYLDDLCEAWEPVGSRITCDPAPTDTDQDILVLVTEKKAPKFIKEMKDSGWKKDGNKELPKEPTPGQYGSWAKYQDGHEEWLKLAEEHNDKYGEMAIVDGEAVFNSWRKEELNIILTLSDEFFDKFIEASNVCKALNVLDKAERCRIFGTMVPKTGAKKEKPKEETQAGSWIPRGASKSLFYGSAGFGLAQAKPEGVQVNLYDVMHQMAMQNATQQNQAMQMKAQAEIALAQQQAIVAQQNFAASIPLDGATWAISEDVIDWGGDDKPTKGFFG